MNTSHAICDDDWSILVRFLPEGWREKAKELGALQRFRAFPDVDALLRTLLDHVAEGCSLRDTSLRATLWRGTPVSDVAIWKRLKLAGTWLSWMAEGVMRRWVKSSRWPLFGDHFRLRVIDATTVQEPGSKGISWRLHYSIELPSLLCTEVHLTGVNRGESFKRFEVTPGDVFMGDRGYAHASGIAHAVRHGGHVIVRVNLTNVPFQDEAGERFALLDRLRSLHTGEVADWDVWVPYEKALIPARICAVRSSAVAQERAVRRARRLNAKKGTVKAETLEAARYIMVLTTLDRSVSATTILECYGARWQIELVFKRLKSLLRLGHLRKNNTESARAWIHAKLLLAMLIDVIQRAARDFFPWGYPLPPGSGQETALCMAGNPFHSRCVETDPDQGNSPTRDVPEGLECHRTQTRGAAQKAHLTDPAPLRPHAITHIS